MSERPKQNPLTELLSIRRIELPPQNKQPESKASRLTIGGRLPDQARSLVIRKITRVESATLVQYEEVR